MRNQTDVKKVRYLSNELIQSQSVEPWAEADLRRRGIKPTGLLGKSHPKGIIGSQYQKLPGVYWDGMGKPRLNAYPDSYFCPIFNEDGLVVGGQWRVKESSSSSKYIWCSAGSKGGISQHINGKTPHTLCNFNTDKRANFTVNEGKGRKVRKNIILFSEGCLKPLVINQLSGYPTIGAVGGNFKGTFEDLECFILKVTNNKSDQFTFALAADAGSGLNELVMSNYRRLANFLKAKYDKKLYVTWYGQYKKNTAILMKI
ncbi:MAG: hypothetical protein WBA93_04315 [Microcoleaceae cyanobacterium]